MTREDALREARRLLKGKGVDTSEMTDADVSEAISDIWRGLKPKIDEIMEFLQASVAITLNDIIKTISMWWSLIPRDIQEEVKNK